MTAGDMNNLGNTWVEDTQLTLDKEMENVGKRLRICTGLTINDVNVSPEQQGDVFLSLAV